MGEIDSIGFAIGYGLIVAGVAMVNVPAALILAGVLLCVAMAAIAMGKAQKRRRDQ
jgi:Flp pilus assembly protein TadB